MSGRFFRGGRHFVQTALQQVRRSHRSQVHLNVATPFTITFTSPAAMSAAAMQSAPIASSGGAIAGATAEGVRASSTSAGRGCGSPSCCQGVTAITSAEDGEEPFIGAPSLSSSASNNSSSRGATTSGDSVANSGTGAAEVGAGGEVTPPPRTKCDPYEQGGHPLATVVVQQHMVATLDAGWAYDEPKKLLVRSFEFGRLFRDSGEAKEDSRRLFEFLADLGKIQQYAAHPMYNINVNLRANSVQVMLRTVALRGISFQDLMLATKLDGMWFRITRDKQTRDQLRERHTKAQEAARRAHEKQREEGEKKTQ